MKPLRLPPNQLHRFYRGGAHIAELRGVPHEDDYAPAEDPESFLGLPHVANLGADPALLVKLLDAGERVPPEVT